MKVNFQSLQIEVQRVQDQLREQTIYEFFPQDRVRQIGNPAQVKMEELEKGHGVLEPLIKMAVVRPCV